MFCFTPKGKLIALPRKATPIDFAYAVHTDVGNTAVGCKINGQIAPLMSELDNGDEVEIITSKAQTAPPAAWESIVVTGKARAAIRRATRAAVRTQYAGLGRRIVERLFQRAKIELFRREADRRAAAAGARLDRRRDGGGRAQRNEGLRRRPRDVSRLQGRARRGHGGEAEVGKRLVRPEEADRRSSSRCRKTPRGPAIPIRGINGDLPVRFAPDGGAVPGDRIVGILTPGEGITIYPIQSPALERVRGRRRSAGSTCAGTWKSRRRSASRRGSRCSR